MRRWLNIIVCCGLCATSACNSRGPSNSGATQKGGTIAAVAADNQSVGDFIDSTRLSDGRIAAIFGNASTGALNLAIESSSGSGDLGKASELKPTGNNVGLYNSIARGSDDSLHIVTHDSSRNAILYYRGTSQDVGEPEVIAQAPKGIAGQFGIWGNIQVDANNQPHACYYDGTIGKLYYAYRAPQGWKSTLVLPAASNSSSAHTLLTTDYGRHCRLRLSNHGKWWLASYNASDGDLWLFSSEPSKESDSSPSWNLLVVDSVGDVGSWLDMELDSKAEPIISYYDATHGDLKLARPMAKELQDRLKTLDSEGNVGLDSSLEVSRDDMAHVAYLDASRLNLKYTREDGAPETLDKNGVNGFFPSLQLGNGDYTVLYHLVSRRDASSREFVEQKLLVWPPHEVRVGR